MKYLIFLILLNLTLLTTAQPDIKSSTNQAGILIYKELIKENPESNVFISPYSISNALAMCYVGAKEETAKQMQEVLGFANEVKANSEFFTTTNEEILQNNSKNELNIANALWYERDYNIESTFKQLLSKDFDAEPYAVSFKTADDRKKTANNINRWTEKKTNNNITNIISEEAFEEDSRLVLSNAIYFKGIWQHPFDKDRTHTATFTNYLGEKQEVTFMNANNEVLFFEEEELKMIEIHYAKKRFSFIAILPQSESTLQSIEERLDSEFLEQIITNQSKQKVIIALPKFESDFASNLKDIYEKMGMTIPFSDHANFSGINKNNELKIDQIYHKSFFAISEEGSEAAAATSVVIGTKSAMLNQKKFIANKPFLFLIKENTSGSILFIGRKVSF